MKTKVGGNQLLGGALWLAALLCLPLCGFSAREKAIQWTHLSSKDGDLPTPGASTQQTGSHVADLDGDGINDFVLSFRKVAPALVWYRRTAKGWDRYVIENEFLTVEAGGASFDIDGDGDLDLVFGQDSQGDAVWWWENPAPNFAPAVSWTRHIIKTGGAKQHHDQIFADLKGNGRPQLVFWNQGAKTIFLAELPANPQHTQPWPATAIFTGEAGEAGKVEFKYPEGLAAADVDGDGKVDLLAGNYWFKYTSGKFIPTKIGDLGGRIAAGKFKPGKSPQIVIAPGDGSGPVQLYECKGDPLKTASWTATDLIGRDIIHGHTLDIADVNGDGNLDIFTAEMAKWTNKPDAADNPTATAWILYGDGQGHFTKTELVVGNGWHEGRLADLDGDGDIDVLNKPYTWDAPRVDVWLNNGTGPRKASNKMAAKAPNAFAAFKRQLGGQLGLQLYSLRFEFKKNGLVPTLDWTAQQGFRALEGGDTYGLTREQYRAELDKRGMKMVGVFASFDVLRDKPEEAIGLAKALGAQYVLCGWIPHQAAFTADDVKKAAEVFNRAGRQIKAAGLQFCYHPHGYEFVPTGKGTLFDELAAQTDAQAVGFELDVFWAKHGGQDPVKLLEKYPRRFHLMHLKDLQRGVTGDLTGKAPDETSVALGTGQIDFPAVLAAAKKAGVQWYFIEEESPDAPRNIPVSLQYLARIRR